MAQSTGAKCILCKKKGLSLKQSAFSTLKDAKSKRQVGRLIVGSDGLSPFPSCNYHHQDVYNMFRLGDAELNLHFNGKIFICH